MKYYLLVIAFIVSNKAQSSVTDTSNEPLSRWTVSANLAHAAHAISANSYSNEVSETTAFAANLEYALTPLAYVNIGYVNFGKADLFQYSDTVFTNQGYLTIDSNNQTSSEALRLGINWNALQFNPELSIYLSGGINTWQFKWEQDTFATNGVISLKTHRLYGKDTGLGGWAAAAVHYQYDKHIQLNFGIEHNNLATDIQLGQTGQTINVNFSRVLLGIRYQF
ncbi:hypothetical protein [Aliikangiella maris]|uniref:Porin family protein n=2 Tax=Aliikangiella maris TaxID=3162458 RepID=A0ABV3MNF7_9GAMM